MTDTMVVADNLIKTGKDEQEGHQMNSCLVFETGNRWFEYEEQQR